MHVLTALDARRIQDFVFASNRLTDIAAGSRLIENFLAEEKIARLANGDGGELILAAGGNVWAQFPSRDAARGFAGRISYAAAKDLPGLEFAASHVPFSPGDLGSALVTAGEALARTKLAPPLFAPLLGIAVNGRCPGTGRPAVALHRSDNTYRPRSSELLARDNVGVQVPGRGNGAAGPDYPLEFDHLGGTKGDTCQIAVVFLDGNGIGSKLRASLLSAQGQPDNWVVERFRTISSGLRARMSGAWHAVEARCTNAIRGAQLQSSQPGRHFDLHSGYLPLRPILQGGDDLTFVCDGRIGLELAATALRAFSGEVPELGQVSACAGVSIVGHHFPVSRALEMAHEECVAAKRQAVRKGHAGAALSWRAGELTPAVTRRPYLLGAADGALDWEWFSGELLGVQKSGLNGEVWRAARNKMKRLGSLALQPAELQRELRAWRNVNDALQLPAPLDDSGRPPTGDSPLLDAVELSDLYWALPEVTK